MMASTGEPFDNKVTVGYDLYDETESYGGR